MENTFLFQRRALIVKTLGLSFAFATTSVMAGGPLPPNRFAELAAQRDATAGELIYRTDREIVFLRSVDPSTGDACEQVRQTLPSTYAAELAAYEARAANFEAERRAWNEQFQRLKPAYDRDRNLAEQELNRAEAAASSAAERSRLGVEYLTVTLPDLQRRHFGSIGLTGPTLGPRPRPPAGLQVDRPRTVAFTLLARHRGLDDLPYRRLEPTDTNFDSHVEVVPVVFGHPTALSPRLGSKARPNQRDERLREGVVHPQEVQRLIETLAPHAEKRCRHADRFTIDLGFYDLLTMAQGGRWIGSHPTMRLEFARDQGRWRPLHQVILQSGSDYSLPRRPGEKMDEYMVRQRLFPLTKAQVILSNPANAAVDPIPYATSGKNLFWLDTPELDYAFCHAFRRDQINSNLRSRAVQRSADYWQKFSPRNTGEYTSKCPEEQYRRDTLRVVFMGYFSHLQFSNYLESSAIAMMYDYSRTCRDKIEREPYTAYQRVLVETTTSGLGGRTERTTPGPTWVVPKQYDAMYQRVKNLGPAQFNYSEFFRVEGCESPAAHQLLQNFNHAVLEKVRHGYMVNVKPF